MIDPAVVPTLVDATSTTTPLVDAAAKLVLKDGLLGVALLVLANVVYKLYHRIQDLLDKRHEEMKEVATRYQEVISQASKTIDDNTRTLAGLEREIELLRAERRGGGN